MKKIFSLLLAVVITIVSAPLSFAAVFESFNYEVNSDNTVTITGYNNLHLNSVTVPETIDGKTVTAIGDNVFKGKSSLKTFLGLLSHSNSFIIYILPHWNLCVKNENDVGM